MRAIGFDPTLDAAVATFQGRFGLSTCELVPVGPDPSTWAAGAKLRLHAEVRTTGLLTEIDLDIPVNLGNRPRFTYGAFSREVFDSIANRPSAELQVLAVF